MSHTPRARSVGALSLVAFLLVAAAPASAETFEDEAYGYRLEVPAGWRAKPDELGGGVLLGAPSGLRIRVEAEVPDQPLDSEVVLSSYRRDGRGLKGRYGKVKVAARPGSAGKLGPRPAQGYALRYRDLDGTVSELRARLAEGDALEEGMLLRIRVRILGSLQAQEVETPDVERVLASFRWPAAEVIEIVAEAPAEPVPSAPGIPADLMASVEPMVEALGDDTASKLAAMVASGNFDPAAVKAAVSKLNGSSGPRSFDRGSLKGGVGFMAEATVIDDDELSAQLDSTFRVSSAERTEEEQAKAAAYLGFARPGAAR